MRKYWSQIAMLLLGITLTVGFYEGRKLVKNTAKALTAATAISGSASPTRHHAPDEDADLPDDSPESALGVADNDEPHGDRHRRFPRQDRVSPIFRGAQPDLRVDRVNLLRQRQRQRLAGRPGGPVGPAVPPIAVEEPDDDQVDTAYSKPSDDPSPPHP